MRILLLFFLFLSSYSHAVVQYTADFSTVPTGNDIEDNPPGGTSEGDWTQNGQQAGRTHTIEDGVLLSGSKVMALFAGSGSFDIMIAGNTKTSYSGGMSFQSRIGLPAGSTRVAVLYIYMSGTETTTGPNESYRLEYAHTSTRLSIRRDNTILALNTSFTVSDPTDFTMKLEIDGDGNLTATVDGTEELTAGPDTTYTSGGFGVFVQQNNGTVEFTDLVVDDLVSSDGNNDGLDVVPTLFQNYSKLLEKFFGFFSTPLYAGIKEDLADTHRRWVGIKKRYNNHTRRVLALKNRMVRS